MWSYYGSKSKVVHLYPRPVHDKIIEPFAGSARYALRWWERDVLLVDKYPVIVSLWHYLQRASRNDILKMRAPETGETIDRKNFDCVEQSWLMGFMVQGGVNSPRLTVSSIRDSSYIESQKRLIADNLHKIKHWTIELGDYRDIPNQTATWFIDPPYQFGGHEYKFSNKDINFSELGEWCKTRDGQAIVCENTKATWMPFFNLRRMTGTYQTTTEAIWSNLPTDFDVRQGELFQGGV